MTSQHPIQELQNGRVLTSDGVRLFSVRNNLTVYIDFPKIRSGRISAHLMADSKEELHEFANEYGIKRCWYDGNRKHPHYDLLNGSLERILEVLALCVCY